MDDYREDIPHTHQRSARNDPAMRDGDSAHGNPYEPAGDEVALDSDSDIGDTTVDEEMVEELTVSETESVVVDQPQEPGPEMPISEYDRFTIPEVLERANGLSKQELSEVAAYERAHRNRKTLLAKLDRMINSPEQMA